MIEDENLFIRKNWVTQRNTRGYGTKRNYMSAREDFLFLTKTQNIHSMSLILKNKAKEKI